MDPGSVLPFEQAITQHLLPSPSPSVSVQVSNDMLDLSIPQRVLILLLRLPTGRGVRHEAVERLSLLHGV
eukprot:824180-Amphidinium_carterae.1